MALFGEILAELRQDKGLTQKQLAKIIYVTPGTISNYENNIHLPDLEKLIALADFFGVTTDFLLGRTESNVSPDFFNKNILAGISTGELVKIIQRLSPERSRALQIIISDMSSNQ